MEVQRLRGSAAEPKDLVLLLLCFITRAYALNHHGAAALPGIPGVGYGGYAGPAPATPYGTYADYSLPPKPYNFGYDTVDEYGNRQFRSEQGDANNVKTGTYGYRDVNGLYRSVNYIADANGFRVSVSTNEPGTAPGGSADAVFNAAPVVPPVPSGAQGASGSPFAYGRRISAPYSSNGYGGGYGYGLNGRTPGRYGYAPQGSAGYTTNAAPLGGYATGYIPSGYVAPGGYNSWTSTPYNYRRRR
ncbi:uncharacterized protein LOC144168336 [Haemaphysalis longicornis]